MKSTCKITGIDPGKHVGIATITIDDGKLATAIRTHEIDGESLLALEEAIELDQPDVVVLESFALLPAKARSLSWNGFIPVEVMGAVKLVCQRNDIKLVIQTPSQIAPWRKSAIAQKLEKSSWKGTHIRDAVAHTLYYAARNGLIRPPTKEANDENI